MKQAIEKNWVDLYLSNVELLDEGLAPALTRPRSGALEAFNLVGLPTKGSGGGDRYHYTDLREAFAGEFEHYFTPSYVGVAAPETLPLSGYRMQFLNGFCCDEVKLTQLDNGLIYGSLAAAAAAYPQLVEAHYNTLDAGGEDALAALAAAFVQDGAFVYVPRGVSLDLPLVVESDGYADQESVASFGRNLFIFEDNARAQLVINYRTLGPESMLINHLREIIVGEGAHVELVELCRFNNRSTLVTGSYARQERSSVLHTLTLLLGGALVRSNQLVELAGPGAENHTDGLILSGEGEHLDMATEIRHVSADCTSYELVKGIAARGGVSVFSGRIFVAPDAQRTQAFQQNNNLLLSDDAHVYTKPQLEIYADDVRCSHGATVGQLDEQALYYMRQRGIAAEDARRLQMYGFAQDLISRCRIEPLTEYLEQIITEKIDAL